MIFYERLAADWVAESETSLVTDGFLMMSISMIKQSCSSLNGNALQLLIEKDAFYGIFYTMQLKTIAKVDLCRPPPPQFLIR